VFLFFFITVHENNKMLVNSNDERSFKSLKCVPEKKEKLTLKG
jgi:hypothetical protein